MSLRELYAGLFSITMTGWVLFHFIMIAKHGTFWIAESRPYVLWAEIVVVSLILILMIERLINDFRRRV